MDNAVVTESKDTNKSKKGIVFTIVIVVILLIAILGFVFKNNIAYSAANYYYNNNNYSQAQSIYKYLDDYKNSKELYEECSKAIKYNRALTDLKSGNYLKAIEAFKGVADYKDSKEKITECKGKLYDEANANLKNKKYEEAIEQFSALGKYKNSKKMILESKYQYSVNNKDSDKYLKELKKADYKSSAKLYKEYYAYSAEVFFNDNPKDLINGISDYETHGTYSMLIRIKNRDGYADKDKKFTAKIIRDGETKTEKVNDMYAFSAIGLDSYVTVKVYDGDTLIGEGKVFASRY